MSASVLRWAAIPRHLLDVPATLTCGQAFRWFRTGSGDWLGASGRTAIRLRPAPDGFWWETLPEAGRWDVIERYFRLDVDLAGLYKQWDRAEPRIGPLLRRWAGLRVLRQEPEEALIAFACACCNTVAKITRSVCALARRHGDVLADVSGHRIFAFPGAARVALADERELREDLWGFRAARLVAMAGVAASRGPAWFERLASLPYRDARGELAALPGIGAKIADCVCLFALGHDGAVPIDTHIRQVSERWFGIPGAGRSLTPSRYDALGDAWRDRFGQYAGWAQQYAFIGETWGGSAATYDRAARSIEGEV